MDQNKDKVFVGEGRGEDKPEMGEEQKQEMELRSLVSDKLVDLQKQVIGIKDLLSDKQEKITIVKNAAKNAISIIESKSEDEKTDFDRETVLELHKELKLLKESADIYSDTIVTFQERIDHLNRQVASIKSHCSSAEGGVDDESRG